MSSLGAAFDMRRNSVNAIRIAMALCVLVFHAYALGGYGDMPTYGFAEPVATYALSTFFVISGYLIMASRLQARSLVDFLWRRVLRIYPAFLAALVLVGFVLAPLSRVIEGRGGYDWSSGVGYVVNNLLLILRQIDVSGTLETVPVPGVWNFSAWTLFYEFTLWVGIGLLVTILPGKLLKPGVWAGFFTFTAIKLYHVAWSGADARYVGEGAAAVNAGEALLAVVEPLARLGIFFMAGALLYVHRDKVGVSWLLVAVCGAVSVALAYLGYFHVLAALPWAYAVMCVGTSTRFSRINHPDDYSYGTYIYAYPVTQVLALVFIDVSMPAFVFIGLCILGTAPLAWLSWHYLEFPATKLRTLTARRGRPRETAPAPEGKI